MIIFCRLLVVHCWPDPRVSNQSKKQYWANVTLSTSRGVIEDSTGDILAHSIPSFSFFVDPKFWNPANAYKLDTCVPKPIIEKLATHLPGRFFPVLRKVGIDKAEKIMKLRLPGLYPVSEMQRLYPNKTLLAHTIGYCGIDDHGQAGLELTWDSVLYSPPETKILVKDSSGQKVDLADVAINSDESRESDIALTINDTLQYIVEAHLKEGAVENGAKWAAAVCMNPHDGTVLAMASWPSFDPNDRSSFVDERHLLNNAVGRVYEPGSTLKPVIMGLSLEKKLVDTHEYFNCTRHIKIADRIVSDPVAYGKLPLEGLIIKSSNVGMSQIGLRFDAFDTYNTLKTWGFGVKPGIELPGVEKGLLPPPDQWWGVVPANIAIGQGIGVTPIQLLTAISAIANGGHILRPYLVHKVTDYSGKLLYLGSRKEVATVLSGETASWLRQVMREVVLRGTGTIVNTPLVAIAGKTGTAQVAKKGVYQKGKWVSSFIGFWPADAPRFSMLVVIGEPSKGKYYGAQVAGPVFRAIVEDACKVGKDKIVAERE